MKKILLVGGGTAGHIMPNLALIPYLENEYQIYYVCANNETDKKFLSDCKFKKYYLPVVKLERKLTLKNALLPFGLLASIKQAKKIIKEVNPDVIFSKGGYVGLPISIASKKFNVPLILHESDYSMGLANKLSQRYAKKILTTFKNTTTKFPNKTICVGTPIRQEIKFGQIKNVIDKSKLHSNKKNLLVIGGSQGSKFFNDFFIKNAKEFCSIYNIILLTGKQDFDKIELPSNFIRLNTVQNIQDYYQLADIVVTRGGANVLFELLYINKPMLIIPLPTNNSRGDQLENARYFSKNKFGDYLLQENCSQIEFLKKINNLLDKKDIYIEAQKNSKFSNANLEIINIIKDNS